jgi:hypothetical protein
VLRMAKAVYCIRQRGRKRREEVSHRGTEARREDLAGERWALDKDVAEGGTPPIKMDGCENKGVAGGAFCKRLKRNGMEEGK